MTERTSGDKETKDRGGGEDRSSGSYLSVHTVMLHTLGPEVAKLLSKPESAALNAFITG